MSCTKYYDLHKFAFNMHTIGGCYFCNYTKLIADRESADVLFTVLLNPNMHIATNVLKR